MIRFFFILGFGFLFNQAFSQSQKINPGLGWKIAETKDANEKIHLLVKGNLVEIRKITEAKGGIYKTSSGIIASVLVPLSAVPKFLENEKIERLEYNSRPMEPLMDSIWTQNANLDSIHAGSTPLDSGYDGTGVIIGMIETGIDWWHSDFLDSTGQTRILWLWEMAQPLGPAPSGFGYGTEWSGTDINTGVADTIGFSGFTSHGQEMTSYAAGDGDTCGHHTGVAPKAQLIMVIYPQTGQASTMIEDAASYIFAKADAAGLPCVINASVGSSFGASHDGLDLRTEFIENLLTAKTGRSMVAAAGNNGLLTYHAGYQATSDSLFTWLKKPSGNIFFEMYADSIDFSGFQFAIGADVQPAFEFRGQTPFLSIGTFTPGIMDSVYLANPSTDTLAKIRFIPYFYNGVYGIEFDIAPDSTTYYYRIITRGTGKVDLWSPHWVNNSLLPTTAIYPGMSNYKMPDSIQNICTSFQGSDKVITVGGFYNRQCYPAFDGTTYCDNSYAAGALLPVSSKGPTRKGEVKPDISAPGSKQFYATYTSFIAPQLPQNLAVCGIHVYRSNGSTSRSAPVVSGMVALYLQKHPDASWNQIKDAITHCATQDSLTTTSVPNNYWGWGKLNGFRAITECGIQDGTAGNPNDAKDYFCFPNPAKNQIQIQYSGVQKIGKVTCRLINLTGVEVAKGNLQNGSGVINTELIPSGIYFLTVNGFSEKTEVQKIIIAH